MDNKNNNQSLPKLSKKRDFIIRLKINLMFIKNILNKLFDFSPLIYGMAIASVLLVFTSVIYWDTNSINTVDQTKKNNYVSYIEKRIEKYKPKESFLQRRVAINMKDNRNNEINSIRFMKNRYRKR